MPVKGGKELLAQALRRRIDMAVANDRARIGRFKVRIIYKRASRRTGKPIKKQ
jgi:hypothetical protein